MIILIHGTNSAGSRKIYSDFKTKAKNPTTFDGEKLKIVDLVQTLEGQGLFVESQELFIDELFSKRKASKELESLILYINEHEKDHAIVIWESKELTAKQAKSFPKAEIKKVDIPKLIFSFLDSLVPNNKEKTIKLFHEILATEEAEFVFFMIVRQFRIMLALCHPEQNVIPAKERSTNVRSGGGQGASPLRGNLLSPQRDPRLREDDKKIKDYDVVIDEVARLAPWQKGKVQKQSDVFGKDRLITLYKKLYDIEAGLKTGQLQLPLVAAVDFFLTEL